MKRPGKQKPRLGWLYVVCHDNAPDLVKIGETDRPIERMRELDNPTILARVPVMSAYDKEQLLHRRFKSQQLPQLEYFRLDKQQLDSVLQSCSKWSAEVAELTIEPHTPEGVQLGEPEAEALPTPTFKPPRIQDSIDEWLNRDSGERRRALEAMQEQLKEHKQLRSYFQGIGRWYDWLRSPEGKRQNMELSRCQEWVKALQDSLSN